MRLVFSLTTLPTRYVELSETLKSLLSQSIKPDKIYLALPKKSRRLGKEYPPLSSDILDIVTVVKSDIDYGPLTKLYGALVMEDDPETLIFVGDDDVVYNKDLVRELVKYSIGRDAVICSTGALIKYGVYGMSIVSAIDNFQKSNPFIGYHIPPEGRKIDLIFGVGGVLYKRKFFPRYEELHKFFDIALNNDALFYNDDVIISGYLCRERIDRMIFNNIPTIVPGKTKEDALSANLYVMLPRFRKSIQEAESIGLFPYYEEIDYSEPIAFKVILIAILIIALIVLIFIS